MATAGGLRGIEADLDSGAQQRFERNQAVANALGESSGHIAQAAEEAFAVFAQQAAVFDQLQQQVGDLHQDIEVPDLPGAEAIGMLQIEPAVLLDVESFIFDLPPASPAAVSEGRGVCVSDGEVRQPDETGRRLADGLHGTSGLFRCPSCVFCSSPASVP